MSSTWRRWPAAAGVLVAVIFGLSLYAAGLRGLLGAAYAAMSLGFLAGVPIAIGFLSVLPLRAPSPSQGLFVPWIAIALIVFVCWLAKWEGLICIVFGLPWLLVFSSIGGMLARQVRQRRARIAASAAALLAPFIVMPIESRIPSATAINTTTSAIDVAAPPHVVWEFVVSVDSIMPHERERAFFTTIGFPAPVTATLDHPRVGGIRRAVFERRVVFTETITEWADAELLGFTIDPNTDSIPPSSLDRHVTIGGGYFDVLTGTYELESIGDSATRLRLTSEHRVSTHFNWYSTWWARRIMADVQSNILRVIATRSERAFAQPEPTLTADMRELESVVLGRGRTTFERYQPTVLNEAVILTGAREVEPAGGAMVAEGATPESAAPTLRGLLREQAAKARATAWLIGTGSGSHDSRIWRYELEDRYARCVNVERDVVVNADGRLTFGPRKLTGCEVSALAESIRRGRRLALMPLDVNSMDVIFTTVGHYRGRVEVYLDSVVVVVRGGALKTKLLDGRRQTVDSVTVSLGERYGSSWSPGRNSNALVTEWLGMEGETRPLPRYVRFTIPRTEGDSLGSRWLVFTHHLTVPKTAGNPLGLAWTYAHGPPEMFRGR